MPRPLTTQEAHEFLDSKPGWIVLTTLGPDGFPHTVPLGYFRLGDEILMGVRAHTLKLRNIGHNPNVSLLLETGSTMQDIKGLMVQGTATVHTEPDEICTTPVKPPGFAASPRMTCPPSLVPAPPTSG